MATTFKDVLDTTKLFQIATDVRELLCDMENSPHWTETMEKGLKQYASTHSKEELLAFKAALHFHIFWVCGEYLFETILLPVENLVEKIGACDLSQDNYRFKLVSMF
jgi:hypothetical protein